VNEDLKKIAKQPGLLAQEFLASYLHKFPFFVRIPEPVLFDYLQQSKLTVMELDEG
jgi:hypothetical protein